jgi:ketosteroid isomerase-like protein
MNRHHSIARTAGALLVSATLVIAGAGAGNAQQSGGQTVRAAIEAFHAALEKRDAPTMAALWVHAPGVTLINPRDRRIAVGWDDVEKDWRATFDSLSDLKVTQTDGLHIWTVGTTAWATGMVDAAGKLKTGATFTAPTFEQSIFERRGGRWLLVSHAAWRVPKQP